MQFKTTLGFQLTSVRMAKIKKVDDSEHWWRRESMTFVTFGVSVS